LGRTGNEPQVSTERVPAPPSVPLTAVSSPPKPGLIASTYPAAVTKDAASWAFEAGTEIGAGRTVVRLLGGGDRYEAWLGWDDHLCALVVVKLLRPDQVERSSARAAIAREADVLSSLAHPAVVRLFGADVDGPRPYLVLEFLDGPRLSTLLRRYGPLSPEQVVSLAAEVASALGYLHNERLLHLDVKPQNIIMSARPKLIDLSIARRFDEVALLTAPLGTDAYMAPEQCLPEMLGDIGAWSDVWGLGATLFEAANGYRPFRARSVGEPHPQLREAPAAFHPRVPPALADAISGCLAREPADRPQVAAVADAIEQLLEDSRAVALRRLRRRTR
jgi:eukaryotic-like serine/threonine-protein kinase